MFQKIKRIEDSELLDTFRDQKCIGCGRWGCDPAHIKSRGSGGDDVADNLISLCRECHSEQHQMGWNRFSERRPAIHFELRRKGWSIISGRLIKI